MARAPAVFQSVEPCWGNPLLLVPMHLWGWGRQHMLNPRWVSSEEGQAPTSLESQTLLAIQLKLQCWSGRQAKTKAIWFIGLSMIDTTHQQNISHSESTERMAAVGICFASQVFMVFFLQVFGADVEFED